MFGLCEASNLLCPVCWTGSSHNQVRFLTTVLSSPFSSSLGSLTLTSDDGSEDPPRLWDTAKNWYLETWGIKTLQKLTHCSSLSFLFCSHRWPGSRPVMVACGMVLFWIWK